MVSAVYGSVVTRRVWGPLLFWGILIGLFCTLRLNAEEYRTFTSTDGAQIEATVIELEDGEKVTIRRKDGREFKDVPLDRFSSADREYLVEWRKQQRAELDNALLTNDSRIKVTVLKGKDEDFNDYGDIDDRVIEISPEIIVDNEEIEKTFRNISGTLVIIGRGVIERDSYVILNKQNFKDIQVEPRSRTRWEGYKFIVRYDPDYGGFDYEGYLVVLRNREGKIVYSRASKSAWEEEPSQLLKAQKRKGYDRKFEKQALLFTTFGLPK